MSCLRLEGSRLQWLDHPRLKRASQYHVESRKSQLDCSAIQTKKSQPEEAKVVRANTTPPHQGNQPSFSLASGSRKRRSWHEEADLMVRHDEVEEGQCLGMFRHFQTRNRETKTDEPRTKGKYVFVATHCEKPPP